jgi:hypothetical protein
VAITRQPRRSSNVQTDSPTRIGIRSQCSECKELSGNLLTCKRSSTSNPFSFIYFRTLLRNGALPTPFPSITSALFPIQRGVGGSGLTNRRFQNSRLAPRHWFTPSECHSSLATVCVSASAHHRLPWCPASGAAACGDSFLSPVTDHYSSHQPRIRSYQSSVRGFFSLSRVTDHRSRITILLTSHESRVTVCQPVRSMQE